MNCWFGRKCQSHVIALRDWPWLDPCRTHQKRNWTIWRLTNSMLLGNDSWCFFLILFWWLDRHSFVMSHNYWHILYHYTPSCTCTYNNIYVDEYNRYVYECAHVDSPSLYLSLCIYTLLVLALALPPSLPPSLPSLSLSPRILYI